MKPLPLLLLSLFLFSCAKNQIEKKQKEPNTFYDLAYEFRDKNKADSAFLYFLKAKDLAILQKDSLVTGVSLLNLAIISADRRDDLTSQEFALAALAYFNKQNKKHHLYLSSNYNCLGKASQNLRDYSNAATFFDLAIKFSKNPNDLNLYLNNKAYLYQETKQYKKALEIYSKLEKASFDDESKYAMALSNASYNKWLIDPNYNVLPQLLKALHIREKEKDLWGQNSSYNYLSDYYITSNPDSAGLYARKMYLTAKKLGSSDDQLYALQKLIKLSGGPLKNHYFNRYLKLDDSSQMSRNAYKNQFALIRYGVAESKADNLRLQRDNTNKKYQIVIILGISLLTFITGLFWYRRRKKTLKQEKEIEVKNTEIKYVKKIHDHVANRIYQVIDEIDNRPEMEKEEVAEKLDVIYHITRDLSYENNNNKYKNDFAKSLSKMFSSYQSTKVTISVNGNDEKLWADIQENVKSEIFAILQELMTNMSKHSQATEVRLQLERTSQIVNINYSDNGIGIQKETSFGNGLKNTETRIHGIAGNITFENNNNNGLQVNITFPVA